MSTEIAVAREAVAPAVPETTSGVIDVYVPPATDVPPLKLDSLWPAITVAGLFGFATEGAAFVAATQIGAEGSGGALFVALVLALFGLGCWAFALQLATKRGVL